MTVARAAYHHGNLRFALLEASLKLIEEKGVRALTLREIGTRVGVSRMAAYRHFADKAALLGAIREIGFSQFADALDAARQADPLASLNAMALAYVRFAAEHRAHFEVMFGQQSRSPDCPEPDDPAGVRAFTILEETVRAAQHQGQVHPGDSVVMARVLWALVHGLSILGMEPDTQFAAEVLVTGLAPRSS